MRELFKTINVGSAVLLIGAIATLITTRNVGDAISLTILAIIFWPEARRKVFGGVMG